jgi:hypothetical protein
VGFCSHVRDLDEAKVKDDDIIGLVLATRYWTDIEMTSETLTDELLSAEEEEIDKWSHLLCE